MFNLQNNNLIKSKIILKKDVFKFLLNINKIIWHNFYL